MNTKEAHEYIYLAAAAGAIWLLWWVWQRNNKPIAAAANPSQDNFPIPWGQPMDAVYAANPDAFSPPSNADLTLNLNDPYASMLDSAYMPLFGFVGIAQGVAM